MATPSLVTRFELESIADHGGEDIVGSAVCHLLASGVSTTPSSTVELSCYFCFYCGSFSSYNPRSGEQGIVTILARSAHELPTAQLSHRPRIAPGPADLAASL